MNLKDISVDVVDREYNSLCPTTALIARTLVNRERAEWIGENKIRLLKTKKDWIKLKNIVVVEERRMCYICERIIPEEENATVDHVNPKSRYGKDERKNLHCCCKRCNDDKSSMTLYEYYKHVKKEVEVNNKYNYINLDRLKNVMVSHKS